MFATRRGVDSHGIFGVLPRMVEELRSGRVKPSNPVLVLHEGDAVARLDGNEGPGPTIGAYAMDLAIAKASRHGLGAVTVSNCNHFGAASFYAVRALDHDQIGIVMCNSDPRVAPHGGAEGALGTNPISYAIPAGDAEPLVFDIATSTTAAGQIAKAQRQGKPIPAGWALDAHGRATTDAAAARGGVLLPMAGHKGYGLAVLVDVLSGALAGGLCGRDVPMSSSKGQRGQSFFFLAIDVSHFLAASEFARRVDGLVDDLHGVRPAEGFAEVMAPGEPELRAAERREAEGIPTNEEEWADLLRRLGAAGVDVDAIARRYSPEG
jgi:LDH2 family malate/lactate/ureidoglycolate dehydrogenase